MCYKRTGYNDMPLPRTSGRLSVSHVHPSIHLFPRVLFTAVLQLVQYLFVSPVCFRSVK